jgi:hypothetical protein
MHGTLLHAGRVCGQGSSDLAEVWHAFGASSSQLSLPLKSPTKKLLSSRPLVQLEQHKLVDEQVDPIQDHYHACSEGIVIDFQHASPASTKYLADSLIAHQLLVFCDYTRACGRGEPAPACPEEQEK